MRNEDKAVERTFGALSLEGDKPWVVSGFFLLILSTNH